MLMIEIYTETPNVPIKSACVVCFKPIGTRACVHIKTDIGVRIWAHADCTHISGRIHGVIKCSR